jgi:hypothetical protein
MNSTPGGDRKKQLLKYIEQITEIDDKKNTR